MKVFLGKAKLKGEITVIGSKSFAHRFLIASFLSGRKCIVHNVPPSRDIDATLNCIRSLGGIASFSDGTVVTEPGKTGPGVPVLDCIESGSTFRFFAPVAMALCDKAVIRGSERLLERGIDGYQDVFRKSGISASRSSEGLVLSGSLQPGEYEISGALSSQYITGLLFALPLLGSDSVIHILPPVNSRNYIDITLSVLSSSGIRFTRNGNDILIPGNQRYSASDSVTEGDCSNAAFLEAFNSLGSDIRVNGLNEKTLQGDAVYRDYFRKLNAGPALLDVTNCIDLAPVLFAFASLKHGGTFTGTSRLALKESDRAAAMKEELIKTGSLVEIHENSVIVSPCDRNAFPDNVVFASHNDHRVAMALSLFSAERNIVIEDAESVNKSYPGYFDELRKLGGKITYGRE